MKNECHNGDPEGRDRTHRILLSGRSPFAGGGRRLADWGRAALAGLGPAEFWQQALYCVRPQAYFRRREKRADVFYLFKENAARRGMLRQLQEGGDVGLAAEQLFGFAELAKQGRSLDCNLRLPRVKSSAEALRNWWDRCLAPRTGIGLGDEYSVQAHLWQMNRARVVLATNDNVGLPAARLRARGKLKTPLVYISIGLPERIQAVAERCPARAKRYQRVLARVDRFVAYGFAEAEWLRGWIGSSANVSFIPFGVDTARWCPQDGGAFIWDVVSIGTDPMRDFGLLVDYAKQHPAVRVALITGGERLATLDPLPANIDVQMKLPIDKVRETIARARMVVLPVRENTYSGATTTLLQCMAMGKAVAVTRVGAIRDGYGFKEDVNLRWMEPGSPESLSRAVDSLLADAGARRRIGVAARRHVEECLGWDRYVRGIESCLAAGEVKEKAK